MFFDEETTARVREEFTPGIAADTLGLKTKRIGRDTSILCPVHDDRHFGSCRIMDGGRRCTCFVCGRSFNGIELYMAGTGKGFYDAVCDAAQHLGIAPDGPRSRRGSGPRLITPDERKFLGLAAQKNIRMVTGMACMKPADGRFFMEYGDWDDVLEPHYVTYDVPPGNPLGQLREEDPETYSWMVRRRALSRWEDAMTVLFEDDGTLDLELALDLARTAERAKELYLEFGGTADGLAAGRERMQ